MSLAGKFATVGGATFASRVLGFARETMMAAALGTGPMADVFYAAFRFPNLFRRLFAEGAFNAAFVPLFSKEIEQSGVEGAKRFSEEVFGVLFSVLFIMTVAMELAMPLLVRFIIAPGFADDAEKFDMTVRLASVMFPYLICMSLMAMMSGMLNSLHRYFAAAIAPVFLNVVLIAVLGAGVYLQADPVLMANYLAWGVLTAGLVQLAVVYFDVRRAGMRFRWRMPKITPKIRRLVALAVPAAVTGGVIQINQIIGQAVASGKEGAISALQYADRLYQLPLGVVGVAGGVVLLPELSRALKAGDTGEASRVQNRTIEFVLFLTVPAAFGLMAISPEITRVLYERGAFGPQTTALVAAIMTVYAFGLPAFALTKALQPAFYARENTKLPMRFTLIAVVINSALAISLFPILAERGIALAEVVSGWTNVILLATTLILSGHLRFDKLLMRRGPLIIVSAAVMALAVRYAAGSMSGWFTPASPFLHQLGGLVLLLLLAALVYFGLVIATGGVNKALLARMLKRSGSGKS
ncbi:murein biosynthesis integral membrane protein MurJ [Martelella mediterranea]|uniref:Probable lipid II flippase MurJ n=1 Tax=Martelella mediterranea TaxID=293089 RepID=A0A4R3NVU5_9HYPH|nr:murein biosynthesis integral membrane protein MurJ [Martelella mediterranea]TCT43035.1 putative peptidoglycan lipid II flippase [Martelella mediterranea]